MNPVKALRTRECRWVGDHHAVLFGGEQWTGTTAVKLPPDPILAEIEQLALSTGLMNRLADHGGDVAAMLAALPEDLHATLAAAAADIRTRHTAVQEAPACL